MRCFHIVLVHHGIVHGGVYFRMTEEFLHLLDGHSFSNGICCEGSAEFMGMNAMHVEALSDFAEP